MNKINFYFERQHNDVWHIANKSTQPGVENAYLYALLTFLDEVQYSYMKSTDLVADAKNIVLYPLHMHASVLDDSNLFHRHANGETLDLLRQGRLSLMVLNPSEAMTSHLVDFDRWKELHVAAGIPADRIYLLSANLRPTDDSHIPYDYWQHDHSLVVQRRERLRSFFWSLPDRPFHRELEDHEAAHELVNIEDYLDLHQKPFLFLSLNRNCRPHRATLLSRLQQEGLLDRANYSVLWSRDAFDIYAPSSYKWREASHHDYFTKTYLPSYQPRVLDHTYDYAVGDRDRSFSYEGYYVSSYFSLVTETTASTVRKPVLWLTEKTYKPIACGHPFMVMGCPGTLAHLRSEGYETFPEWFDESYDTIESEADRREAIVAQIRGLSKLPPEELDRRASLVRDKLLHNRRLLLTRDYKYLYDRIFEKVR